MFVVFFTIGLAKVISHRGDKNHSRLVCSSKPQSISRVAANYQQIKRVYVGPSLMPLSYLKHVWLIFIMETEIECLICVFLSL